MSVPQTVAKCSRATGKYSRTSSYIFKLSEFPSFNDTMLYKLHNNLNLTGNIEMQIVDVHLPMSFGAILPRVGGTPSPD